MFYTNKNTILFINLIIKDSMNTDNQNIQKASNVEEGKTIAIIAYLTIIGLIIAFVLNNDKKNTFAAYHIRQSLGIALTGLALSVVNIIPILGWLVSIIGGVILIIMVIQGLLAALGGKEKPVMILGEKYQEWLKTI